MVVSIRRESFAGLLGLSLMLGVMPACSMAGGRLPSAQADGSARVVRRPIFSNVPRKQFFVKGYGGTIYPPVGSGAGVDPTGYSAAPRKSFFHFGQAWWGR